MCLKELDLRVQNMLIILDSILNLIGGPILPLNEHENLYFDNE
jgi:hypothetical protein